MLVLRLLLTELAQRDLLVVVDDQQRDDAWLKLLRLGPALPHAAELTWLPGLTRLHALLTGARLSRRRRLLRK
jgi:hypothetical protein